MKCKQAKCRGLLFPGLSPARFNKALQNHTKQKKRHLLQDDPNLNIECICTGLLNEQSWQPSAATGVQVS